MDRLPVEILQRIFTLLHQQDKVECMTVSQKWAQIIEGACLFHTLFLNNDENLERITKAFEERPLRALQVECLIMKMDHYNSTGLNNLTSLLSNLRFLLVRSVSTAFIDTQPMIQLWKNHIKHMILLNNASLSASFLSINKLHQLNSLTLDVSHISESELMSNMLSNVPNLSRLVMYSIKISFVGMEMLHSTLPLLQRLTLSFSRLVDGKLPYSIQPAHLLTEFHAEFFDNSISKQIVWLQYITKKYPNISILKINNWFTRFDDQDKNLIESLGLPEGQEKQFKLIGSKLKNLTLNSGIVPRKLFAFMDNTAIQLKHLKLTPTNYHPVIESMELSNQLQRIETLEIDEMYPLELHWLKGMPSIKRLALKLAFTPYEIDFILDMCPDTLKSLELNCNHHYLLFRDSKKQYSLERLIIKAAYLPEIFDAFISEQLPQLHSLTFTDCHFKEKIIRAPKHHFLYFKASTVVLVVTEESKTIYRSRYCSELLNLVQNYKNSYITPLYPYTESVLFDPSEHIPYFILKCASVKNVDTI